MLSRLPAVGAIVVCLGLGAPARAQSPGEVVRAVRSCAAGTSQLPSLLESLAGLQNVEAGVPAGVAALHPLGGTGVATFRTGVAFPPNTTDRLHRFYLKTRPSDTIDNLFLTTEAERRMIGDEAKAAGVDLDDILQAIADDQREVVAWLESVMSPAEGAPVLEATWIAYDQGVDLEMPDTHKDDAYLRLPKTLPSRRGGKRTLYDPTGQVADFGVEPEDLTQAKWHETVVITGMERALFLETLVGGPGQTPLANMHADNPTLGRPRVVLVHDINGGLYTELKDAAGRIARLGTGRSSPATVAKRVKENPQLYALIRGAKDKPAAQRVLVLYLSGAGIAEPDARALLEAVWRLR